MQSLLVSKSFLLFSLLFCLMYAVIVGDNISETLLLTFYSTDQLSLMFIINALGLMCISLIVMGKIDNIPRLTLYSILVGIQCVVLTAIWACILLNFQPAFLFLFSFAYISKILLFLVFWTVANDLCDSREAKSVFPIVGGGGVLGGTIACFSTAFLVKLVGPGNMLFLWIVLLLLSAGILLRLNKVFKKELSFVKKGSHKQTPFLKDLQQNFNLVSKEPLLRSMSVLYFLIFFLLISLDFHFFTSLKSGLTEMLVLSGQERAIELVPGSPEFRAELSKELSSFLGLFRGLSNTVTFLIQLSITGIILRTLGTARSMFTLPFVFTFIFLVCFLEAKFQIFPPHIHNLPAPFNNTMFLIIMTGTALRIALFDSLFSPNFQIFFSSLPTNIRGRGKMFIEGIAKPLAIMLAGGSVLWVGFFLLKKAPELVWIHYLALFVTGLALCFIVIRLQKGYTDSISKSLGGDKAEQIASVLNVDDWKAKDNIIELLVTQLFDPEEDLQLLSIEILSQLDTPRATKRLEKVLHLKSYSKRADVIRALGRNRRLHWLSLELESLLWDEDPNLVEACIEATISMPYNERETLIMPYIQHENLIYSLSAIKVMWKEGNDLIKTTIKERLNHILQKANVKELEKLMECVSELEDLRLVEFMEKAHEKILESKPGLAHLEKYLLCASKIPSAEYLAKIFSNHEIKSDLVKKRLIDNMSSQFDIVEQNVEKWCSQFDSLQMQNLLEFLFRQRHRPSKSLQKIFKIKLSDSIKQAYQTACKISALSKQNDSKSKLLMHSLQEGPYLNILTNISRLIAMVETSGRLYYVIPRLFSTDKFHKTTAIEAIETLLPRDLHEKITPLFLENDFDKLVKKAGSLGWSEPESPEQIADFYAHQKLFHWAQICGIYYQIIKNPKENREIQLKELHNLLTAH